MRISFKIVDGRLIVYDPDTGRWVENILDAGYITGRCGDVTLKLTLDCPDLRVEEALEGSVIAEFADRS